jgi:hypothetical protein
MLIRLKRKDMSRLQKFDEKREHGESHRSDVEIQSRQKKRTFHLEDRALSALLLVRALTPFS